MFTEEIIIIKSKKDWKDLPLNRKLMVVTWIFYILIGISIAVSVIALLLPWILAIIGICVISICLVGVYVLIRYGLIDFLSRRYHGPEE